MRTSLGGSAAEATGGSMFYPITSRAGRGRKRELDVSAAAMPPFDSGPVRRISPRDKRIRGD